jgi:hypothetical protein
VNVDSRIVLTGFPDGSREPVHLRVERTIGDLLARHPSALRQITTTVSLPGSGGLLVQCRIVAHSASGDPVIIEESAETVQAALDGAAERLDRRLGPTPVGTHLGRRLLNIWRRRHRRNPSAS